MSDVIPDISEAWLPTGSPSRDPCCLSVGLGFDVVEDQTGERAVFSVFIRFEAEKEIENKEKRSKPRDILQKRDDRHGDLVELICHHRRLEQVALFGL